MHLLNLLKGNKLTILLTVLLAVSVYGAWKSHDDLKATSAQIDQSYDIFEKTIDRQKGTNMFLANRIKRNIMDLYANDTVFIPVVDRINLLSNEVDSVFQIHLDLNSYTVINLRSTISEYNNQLNRLIEDDKSLSKIKRELKDDIELSDDLQENRKTILMLKLNTKHLQNELLSAIENYLKINEPYYSL